MYEVTWQQSGDGSSLRNTTTTETSYTIEGLTPGTSYEIGVGAYCKEKASIKVYRNVTLTVADLDCKKLLCAYLKYIIHMISK